MITGKQAERKFKLGMHTYTLHLSGLGESWGFQSEGKTFAFEKVINLDKLMDMCVEEGIEVIHMTLVDLDDDLSDKHLAEVKEKAERLGLDLELNISFNAPSDPRVNCTIEEVFRDRPQAGLQAGQIQHRRGASPSHFPLLHVPGGHGADGEDRHGF